MAGCVGPSVHRNRCSGPHDQGRHRLQNRGRFVERHPSEQQRGAAGAAEGFVVPKRRSFPKPMGLGGIEKRRKEVFDPKVTKSFPNEMVDGHAII